MVGRAMRLLVGFLVFVGAVGVVAHLTRPTQAQFELMLEDAVRNRIAATELEQTDDVGHAFVLAGCKLRTAQCVQLLMASVKVEVQRGLLTTSLEYEGLKQRGQCIGAFGRFWCRGDKIG